MSGAREPEVTLEVSKAHGLTEAEHDRMLKILGRTPSFTELGLFMSMWSEHCSYKSSRVHLGTLPTTGPAVIQGPGENAGIVDIGDGQAAVFKMESHNHPSFVEPYQGAATGVGGILRDVFTMGARPIANMNCLRFGPPEHPRTSYLVGGVVRGIGDYGNAVGVPTVGGDVAFDDCYAGNILVNAFTLGLARADRIFYGKAAGLGNAVIYFGAKTGRDGIHGASLLASAEFDDSSEEKRPTVQVGDPFTEKLLLEATLELMAVPGLLVGIQDMGAAGLTSSSVEMASRAGNGVEIDLDKVPAREPGMSAYELMLSESQERMLAVVDKDRVAEALAIFDKWDLDSAEIGRVTDTGRVVIKKDGLVAADVPADPLAEGLKYERPRARPSELDALQAFDPASLPAPQDFGIALLVLLASPNVASKAWVYHQYDHMVRLGTVVRPGSDAAIVRVLRPDGGAKGIGVASGCNQRHCHLDPYEGARLAIAACARNLAATGARPLAVTDCLNFGNPEKPEVMWQFAEAVRGLGDACRALGTPIVSGNVSFYNDTDGRSIYPTPMIGMIGLCDDPVKAVTQWWKGQGDLVALLGPAAPGLGGSEWMKVFHGKVAGRPPALDIAMEKRVQAACLAMIGRGLLHSAHDVSEGGLAVTLAECAMSGPENVGAGASPGYVPIGADLTLPASSLSATELLFSEAPSRIVVSFSPSDRAEIERMAKEAGAPLEVLGKTGGRDLRIAVGTGAATSIINLPLADLARAWRGGFSQVVA